MYFQPISEIVNFLKVLTGIAGKSKESVFAPDSVISAFIKLLI
jgi:hypothetical protein